MGDRANIVIRDNWPSDLGDREAVFLYSYWGGEELPETLRQGLSAAHGRWGDDSYLARVIFQTMIGSDDGVTGYGISTRLTDNEYALLVLYKERVYWVPENKYKQDGFAKLSEGRSCTFDDVVDSDADQMTWEILDALCTLSVEV
jgi:hypothetical protein